MKYGLLILLFVKTLAFSCIAYAEEIHIAVAQSIETPMQYVCAKFKQNSHHRCKITTAGTGHLYAQSMFGSSYAMLIGSNSTYTQGLINAGKADDAMRMNLAVSPLVLWGAADNFDENSLKACLLKDNGPGVRIADPTLAGFGEASKVILDNCTSWKAVQKRIEYGSSVEQVYQTLQKDHSLIGFVALSQLDAKVRAARKYWQPDVNSYEAVRYEVIVFNSYAESKAVRELYEFLQTADAKAILEEAGFQSPASREA